MQIVTLVPCERKKHEMDNIDKERNEQVYSIVKQKEREKNMKWIISIKKGMNKCIQS